MGWKSTIDITRSEAIRAIIDTINRKSYDEMSNEELEDVMYGLGIGDDVGKPYFGHNFNIKDKLDE
jgi:hypothetical protein